MPRIKNTLPVDYTKCNQTVTVYHKDGETYSQRVIENAFFDFKKVKNVDKTGSSEASSFLLVVPCDAQCVFVGDKVFLGVGTEITSREGWAALIPSKMPGLAVVKYVDAKYWQGKIVHTEAGG